MADEGQLERAQDVGSDSAAEVKRWLRELDLADKHEDKWRKRAQKVIERYRDEKRSDESESGDKRFNILYANTEILKGVVYSRAPVPDVRRRFRDKDPIGRQAAQIMQRALSYCGDAYDFDGELKLARDDVLLPGRAVMRVRYKPTLAEVDGEERVVYQEVDATAVEWDMFRCSPARRWAKVRWVAFGELLTRDELVAQFGKDIGNACKLDWAPKGEDKDDEKDNALFKRALVWTIWDKTSKNVIAVTTGYDKAPLRVTPDPLNLEGFFPCPKPGYSICTSDSLIPIPEFCQYQDQADELDELTERISVLVSALRRRGAYDASFPELAKLNTLGDNEFIAVESQRNLTEKGGFDKALWTEPVDKLVAVVRELYVQREACKATIYEETGIADIVRGATKASETATAQEIKGRWANARINGRQDAIAHLARDVLRLKGEIIAEKFSPDVLKRITGPELWVIETVQPGPNGMPQTVKVDATEQIMAVLRNDKLRGFAIDIETDSTVLPDAVNEQKSRTEFLAGVTQFTQAMVPAVQAGIITMDVAKEFIAFGARAFKASPQLEEAIEKIGGSAEDKAQKVMKQQQASQVQKAMLDTELRERNAKAAKEEADAKKSEAEAAKLQRELLTGVPADGAGQPPVDVAHDEALKQYERVTKGAQARKAVADADDAEQKTALQASQRRQTEIDEEAMVRNEEFMKVLEQVIGQMGETSAQMAQAADRMAQAAETMASPRKLVKDKRTGEKMSVPVRLNS